MHRTLGARLTGGEDGAGGLEGKLEVCSMVDLQIRQALCVNLPSLLVMETGTQLLAVASVSDVEADNRVPQDDFLLTSALLGTRHC